MIFFSLLNYLTSSVSQASLNFDCMLSKHSTFARGRVLFHRDLTTDYSAAYYVSRILKPGFSGKPFKFSYLVLHK